MSNNQRNIAIGLVIVVLCGLAFYFFYWVKTPVYSLNLIRESIQKHDVVQFKKHVDMDTLYSKAIEDTLVAVDKIEGTDIMSNPFASSIVQILKEPAVEVLKDETIKYVEGDEESRPVEEADRFAEELKEKADTENVELKEVSVIEEKGNRAYVAIKLYNTQLDKNFTLKVKMNKLVDGYWRIKEITNLVDFLIEVDEARKAKLAELNEKIKVEIDDAIYVPKANVELVTDYNPYYTNYKLHYNFVVQNIGTKDIAKFYANVLVLDKNNELLREVNEMGYSESVLKVNSERELWFSEALNEFIQEDITTIAKIDGASVQMDIYKIVYTDGKVVEFLTELP